MVLKIDFDSEEALYTQLCNQIICGIAMDVLHDGDSLPSVRQLADEIGINMHTVNKAYAVLKQEGFLRLDRRRGAVIALDMDKLRTMEEMKNDLALIVARGICKLLSGLLGTQETEEEDEKYSGVVCPTCGTTYEEFVKDSRFGCPDCYSVFDPLISDHIRHLQGSEKHVGKHPAGFQPDPAVIGEAAGPGEDPVNIPELSKEEKIRLMEARLKDAVRREEYEEAAKLRDEIRALKEEKQNG